MFYAIDNWAYVLRDRPFTVHTDHVNLIRLKEDYMDNKKVQRWLRCFQGYDFDIVTIRGEDNIVADALSRLCVLQEMENCEEMKEASTDSQILKPHIPIRKLQILRSFHNDVAGHHGIKRMISLRQENGRNWEGMREHVESFIQRCPCCQKNDQRRSTIVGRPFTLSSADPMKRIYVDLIENLRRDEDGNQHILVLIDAFSRFLMLYPIKEKTALAVAKAMLIMIGDYGSPRELVSDRGPCFVNDVLDSLLSHNYTRRSSRCPQYTPDANYRPFSISVG